MVQQLDRNFESIFVEILLFHDDHLVNFFDNLIQVFVGIISTPQMIRNEIKGTFIQEKTITFKLIHYPLSIDFDIHGAKLYPRTIIDR